VGFTDLEQKSYIMAGQIAAAILVNEHLKKPDR